MQRVEPILGGATKGLRIENCSESMRGASGFPHARMIDLSRFSSRDFDRGASRLKEAAWYVVKCLFFLPSPPLPSAFRAKLLRLFGAKIGSGLVIRSRVNITFPWRLSVGDHVWLGEEVMILSMAPVTIESNVCVSQRAFLCTGSHDFSKETFDLQAKPITLREGCWVAAQAFVGPGVEVGTCSVVSAGSVALDNVPPNSLVRGNPAVVVKKAG